MLDWASVRWAFCLLYLFISSLLLAAFSMRRTLSIPAPQGGVPYQAPLKRVRPSCVRTPSVWDWSSNLGRMDCGVIYVNSAPDESISYLHVHGSHFLSVACLVFPFSLVWPSLLTCSELLHLSGEAIRPSGLPSVMPLLLIQYATTWLARKRLCRLVEYV